MQLHHLALIATMVFGSLVARVHAAGREIPTDPGYHAALPLPDSNVCTYDLYLPPDYDAKSKNRYPVLIVLGVNNEGSRPFFDDMRLVEWSEANNALIVIVNTNFADFISTADRHADRDLTIMDHYMKLVDAIPQAHANLRFVLDMLNERSEPNRAWAVAARFRQKIAGIVQGPGLHVLNADERLAPVEKDLSIAILHVSRRAWMKAHPDALDYSYDDNYEAWEERVGKILASPQIGAHPLLRITTSDEELSVKPLAEALNFLVDSASLTNVNLAKAEADKFRAAILARINKAAALDDPEARYLALDPFVHVPLFLKSSDGKQALAAWTKAVYDAADKKGPYPRYRFLKALFDFDSVFAAEPERAALKKKLADLQTDPNVKSEIAGEDELAALRRAFVRARNERNVDLAFATVADLDALIARHPNTTVSADAEALKKILPDAMGKFYRRAKPPATKPASDSTPSDVRGPAN